MDYFGHIFISGWCKITYGGPMWPSFLTRAVICELYWPFALSGAPRKGSNVSVVVIYRLTW